MTPIGSVDEFGERESACDPSLTAQALELTLEAVARILLRREPATLDSS